MHRSLWAVELRALVIGNEFVPLIDAEVIARQGSPL
jgi:hypothetical protein